MLSSEDAALTVTEYVPEVVLDAASVTCTVNEALVPIVEGVIVSAPPEDNANELNAGNPPGAVKVYGGVPPDAVNWAMVIFTTPWVTWNTVPVGGESVRAAQVREAALLVTPLNTAVILSEPALAQVNVGFPSPPPVVKLDGVATQSACRVISCVDPSL